MIAKLGRTWRKFYMLEGTTSISKIGTFVFLRVFFFFFFFDFGTNFRKGMLATPPKKIFTLRGYLTPILGCLFLPPTYEIGREVIFSVCLSVHGEGGGEGIPCSLVPGLCGYPSFWSQVPSRRRDTLVRTSIWVPPPASQDQDRVPPSLARTRTGYPPPPDTTGYRQDTPRALRLLRSRRRTFLFYLWVTVTM